MHRTDIKIAIAGTAADTVNYVKYVASAQAVPVVTLEREIIAGCDGLLLPGGGDITPAFYGEQNHGSHNIHTELDILQLQAFDLALRRGLPVMGICKGLQVMNVGLGGTLIQNLEPESQGRHGYDNGDKYHTSVIHEGSWLYELYGGEATVNSAHHQALGQLGEGLYAVQRCPLDGCIEAVAHESRPIIGVQWHPERIDFGTSGTDGGKVLRYFLKLVSDCQSMTRQTLLRPPVQSRSESNSGQTSAQNGSSSGIGPHLTVQQSSLP